MTPHRIHLLPAPRSTASAPRARRHDDRFEPTHSSNRRDDRFELWVALAGWLFEAVAFPLHSRTLEYVGVALGAIAIGMLIARHRFRR